MGAVEVGAEAVLVGDLEALSLGAERDLQVLARLPQDVVRVHRPPRERFRAGRRGIGAERVVRAAEDIVECVLLAAKAALWSWRASLMASASASI